MQALIFNVNSIKNDIYSEKNSVKIIEKEKNSFNQEIINNEIKENSYINNHKRSSKINYVDNLANDNKLFIVETDNDNKERKKSIQMSEKERKKSIHMSEKEKSKEKIIIKNEKTQQQQNFKNNNPEETEITKNHLINKKSSENISEKEIKFEKNEYNNSNSILTIKSENTNNNIINSKIATSNNNSDLNTIEKDNNNIPINIKYANNETIIEESVMNETQKKIGDPFNNPFTMNYNNFYNQVDNNINNNAPMVNELPLDVLNNLENLEDESRITKTNL